MRDPEDPNATWEAAAAMGVAAVATVTISFLLIPVGRGLALVGTLATVWIVARALGREAAWTSVALGYLLSLWVHGTPRFRATIDDPATIRVSAIVLLVGALLAWIGVQQRHRHNGRQRAEERTSVPSHRR